MYRSSPAQQTEPAATVAAPTHLPLSPSRTGGGARARRPHHAALLAACLLLANPLPDAAHAGLYKWVDEQGNVHYGDRPPPNPNAGHVRYNEQGVVVDSKPAALTEAERAAAREAERQRREQVEREEARVHRDRVLLETFTTERDLLLARDDRIGALDAAITLSRKHIDNWGVKLADVEMRITKLNEQGMQAPSLLLGERDSLRRQVTGAEEFSAQKISERSELAGQFEADIARYRELRREQAELMEQLGHN